jgi:hypothetical protein
MSKVKVIVRETVVSHKDFDADECEIIVGGFRDDSSIGMSVFYDNVEIYSGHLNFKSGMAHLTASDDLNEENDELEEYLVEQIECGNY